MSAGFSPLISIFSHLMRGEAQRRPRVIEVLYSTKVTARPIRGEGILFVDRIMDAVARAQDSGVRFRMFLTGIEEEALASATGLPADVTVGRITERDLWNALGPVEGREKTVCYVCGPPQMTDGFVGVLKRQEGMDARRVLCEKWW